ncbi:MAG: hypothetical protein KIT83_08525 [Bryobacterales bacterium]|nr:hypothetical protein [Bryobacterales bacterium]
MSLRIIAFIVAYCGLLAGVSCGGGRDMNNLLKPGVGVGDLRLGERLGHGELNTEETKNKYANDGVWYSFNEAGVLSEIVITSSEYVTDRSIRVGSTTDEVRSAYGPGIETQTTLSQGGSMIGRVGDFTLKYPGIIFLLSREHVAAIRLVDTSVP